MKRIGNRTQRFEPRQTSSRTQVATRTLIDRWFGLLACSRVLWVDNSCTIGGYSDLQGVFHPIVAGAWRRFCPSLILIGFVSKLVEPPQNNWTRWFPVTSTQTGYCDSTKLCTHHGRGFTCPADLHEYASDLGGDLSLFHIIFFPNPHNWTVFPLTSL